MSLQPIREEIDRIDQELVTLFKKRMDCAKQVGEYKKTNGLSVLNEAREKEILDSAETAGGEYGHAARLLFSSIMELSRALQHDITGSGKALRTLLESADFNFDNQASGLKIACQGIEGANSHEAAITAFPNAKLVFFATWEDVFRAVQDEKADYGVLPVENSSAGSVSDVYDLLLKYRFFIAGALDLKIAHCLCALPQCTLSNIEQVWSHPQGLSQCSNYIAKNNLAAVPCSNTAVAAQLVAQEKRLNCAAICSEKAAQAYGLKVLLRNFQNSRDNCTRFIILSKKLFIPEAADKISLCFSLPHVTGSLYNVLCRFSCHGLNLTKIESRPMQDKPFEYLFYLDFSGNVRSPHVMNLMCALSEELPQFNFFGNYQEL